MYANQALVYQSTQEPPITSPPPTPTPASLPPPHQSMELREDAWWVRGIGLDGKPYQVVLAIQDFGSEGAQELANSIKGVLEGITFRSTSRGSDCKNVKVGKEGSDAKRGGGKREGSISGGRDPQDEMISTRKDKKKGVKKYLRKIKKSLNSGKIRTKNLKAGRLGRKGQRKL